MPISFFIKAELDLYPVNHLVDTEFKWQNHIPINRTILALMGLFIVSMMMARIGTEMFHQHMIAFMQMLVFFG